MKNLKSNSGIRMLIPLIVFIGMLSLNAEKLAAQNAQTEQQQVYNWKSAQDARTVMFAQVTNINQQMPGFSEGTPLYDNAIRRIAYYKAIVAEIDRGETVAKSLENAIPAAATLGFSKEATYTSKIVLRALLEETKSMLIN
jgi:hypothetical protein